MAFSMRMHKRISVSNADADDECFCVQLIDAAPVSKVGGHFEWVQDPEDVKCEKCGDMEHFETIANRETGILARKVGYDG